MSRKDMNPWETAAFDQLRSRFQSRRAGNVLFLWNKILPVWERLNELFPNHYRKADRGWLERHRHLPFESDNVNPEYLQGIQEATEAAEFLFPPISKRRSGSPPRRENSESAAAVSRHEPHQRKRVVVKTEPKERSADLGDFPFVIKREPEEYTTYFGGSPSAHVDFGQGVVSDSDNESSSHALAQQQFLPFVPYQHVAEHHAQGILGRGFYEEPHSTAELFDKLNQ